MIRVRTENANTPAEWDAIYGGENAARWTIWHDEQLIGEFSASLPQNAHVLDLGCGNGWAPLYMTQRRPDLTWSATDLSAKSLEFLEGLERQGKIHWRELHQLDLNSLNWEAALPGAYDAVMCTEVLEHLEDPRAAVQKILDLARDMAAVTVPNLNATDTKYHVWSIARADVEEWFADCPRLRIVSARKESILACFVWKH